MSRRPKFMDTFWGTEFCCSNGFDNLVKRLKDGREMCKDVEDFLKQRAKIEEEYSKGLMRLAKGNSGHTEIGTIREAWECLKSQMENIALDHSNLSAQLLEQTKQLQSFMEGQKPIRKQEEEAVRKSQKKKTDFFKKNLECKRAYENKCRELENIGVQMASTKQAGGNTDRNNPNYYTPSVKMLQAKEQKAKLDKDKAEQNYKDIVHSLDNARLTWERDMTQMCNVFERLEIERFNYLQNEIWILTNYGSECCVKNDEHYETIRKHLEKCDVDADIDLFINEKSTGQNKPGQIRYCAYLDNDTSYPPHANRAPIATPNRPPIPMNQAHR